MIKKSGFIVTLSTLLVLCGCAKDSDKLAVGGQESTLTAQFNGAFKVGTAISRDQILNKEAKPDLVLVKRHFSTFTPENSMKWERIHPLADQYDFEASDALVAFANSNNLDLIGHTLVWHSQTPEWVFQDKHGEPLDREGLLERMKQHIDSVAGRYRGKIFAWDVVNEAFNEDGSLRESPWSTIIGEDFIVAAFKYAQAAAPNAKLYYNDYNLFKPEKRSGVIRLIKQLKEENVKIDGVGMQGHYALDYPDLNQMEDSIIAFSKEEVDVMITELDVSVLPFPEDKDQGADVSLNMALDTKYNPYKDAISMDTHKALGERYLQIFDILRKHQDKIGRVTFWGVHDKQSWRNDWPMEGRTDYPLLIDRKFKLKDFVTVL